MSLELLPDHKYIHLRVWCRLVEILDVVHDAILSHLVACLCATTPRILVDRRLSCSRATILWMVRSA